MINQTLPTNDCVFCININGNCFKILDQCPLDDSIENFYFLKDQDGFVIVISQYKLAKWNYEVRIPKD